MTVKKGDIVFVSQPHHSTPVPGVVLSVVPAPAEVWPDINVHIISSADPYASARVAHKCYADDSGYLAADEGEPLELRPKETKNADAPQELSEGSAEEPVEEGDGTELVPGESETSEDEEPDSEDQSEEDSSEDEGPFDVEGEANEREEGQSPPPVSAGAQDGKPVSPTGRKRGGRGKR